MIADLPTLAEPTTRKRCMFSGSTLARMFAVSDEPLEREAHRAATAAVPDSAADMDVSDLFPSPELSVRWMDPRTLKPTTERKQQLFWESQSLRFPQFAIFRGRSRPLRQVNCLTTYMLIKNMINGASTLAFHQRDEVIVFLLLIYCILMIDYLLSSSWLSSICDGIRVHFFPFLFYVTNCGDLIFCIVFHIIIVISSSSQIKFLVLSNA